METRTACMISKVFSFLFNEGKSDSAEAVTAEKYCSRPRGIACGFPLF
jgi:hypothetical protein